MNTNMPQESRHPAGPGAGDARIEDGEVARAADDVLQLLSRSAGQLAECQRLSATVTRHERGRRDMATVLERSVMEHDRLARAVAEQARRADELTIRLARYEGEYQRLTRLLAERAREIVELRTALNGVPVAGSRAE